LSGALFVSYNPIIGQKNKNTRVSGINLQEQHTLHIAYLINTHTIYAQKSCLQNEAAQSRAPKIICKRRLGLLPV